MIKNQTQFIVSVLPILIALYLSSAHEETMVALFYFGRIRTHLGVDLHPIDDLTSSHANSLLVQSYQPEIIIVKRLIQGRNNVTRVWVEPKSCDQGRRKHFNRLGGTYFISRFFGHVGQVWSCTTYIRTLVSVLGFLLLHRRRLLTFWKPHLPRFD